MAKLLYQGHGSLRLVTDSGTVVYIDPFAGEGYDLPADIVLVTHEHHDHNVIDKMPHAYGCVIITEAEALAGGKYNYFTVGDVSVRAVEAFNAKHPRNACVGYIVTADGKTAYFSGDTSMTNDMQDMSALCLDWAFLPIDGIYNMDHIEAEECAAVIGAAHTVPIHMKPGGLFDEAMAEAFNVPNRVIIRPGETITL